jgi:hypothetical protein
MNTTLILVCLLILVLLVSSSTKLKSKHYVGEREILSTKEYEQESLWQYEDDAFYVRIVDSTTVIASYLEWNDTIKEYNVVTMEVVPTKIGEDHFLNLKETDGLYNILRMIGTSDGSVAFFGVDEKKLDKDIEDGRIKVSKNNEGDYIPELDKAELDKYVSENINELFKIQTAGLIRPLTKFNKENN